MGGVFLTSDTEVFLRPKWEFTFNYNNSTTTAQLIRYSLSDQLNIHLDITVIGNLYKQISNIREKT